jgi:hypothetical protein
MIKRNDSEMTKRYANGLLDRFVKDGYRNTIKANAKRYARIPTGAYTCPWCVMLASRGYVYRSEDTARAANHAFCNCLVMPMGADVEGYDPDALYDLYKDGKGIGENPAGHVALDVNGKPIKRLPPSGSLDAISQKMGVNKGISESIEKAVSRTNPNFVRGESNGYNINCQRCVPTYEARRRGYSVEALRKTGPEGISFAEDAFIGADGQVLQRTKVYGQSILEARLMAAPENSRFAVTVGWKNKKTFHVFVAERTSEGIIYIDPQTGLLDAASYLPRVKDNKFWYSRIDNAQFASTEVLEKVFVRSEV